MKACMHVTILPEVYAQVEARAKGPVADNGGASASGGHRNGVCLTVLDGHFQPVLEV